jgi:SpoVK/Ycf46/Vps4 family AAA+-type ATPase
VRAAYDDPAAPVDPGVERPACTFKEVGGMEPLKDEIRMKIIHPLAHADLYKAYGKPIGGGILLYGPPGCGKTHLARATAGEISVGFLAVGIHDVLEMWIGNSERNLHEIFEQARRNKPCVLFFDEIDALAASRADMRTGGARQLINQFLSETDGVQNSNEGVLILAATNAPWHLDPAFRRPGRFDRILFVPPPDHAARAAILRIHCQGKPVQDIDYDHLAKKTDQFSGADLKAVLDVAVEQKLREAMKDGLPRPLSTRDLSSAAATVRPSTREWFATARNYAMYSNQGGIYDDILRYMKIT